MLAPRHVLFTAVEGTLLDPGSQSWTAAADALAELERRRTPLVLVTRGTRAQLEPLRSKLQHTHPFVTESGGGLFLPDGYFSVRLEGAVRAARYFCVPFARPYTEVTSALEELAGKARATVVGYSQMSAREIARNTGEPLRAAELARQREFTERFFFAGATPETTARFARAASNFHWEAVPGDPFWELRSGNFENRAVRYLMRLYRTSMRTRLAAVGIGSTSSDMEMLSAADSVLLLPGRGAEFDATLVSTFPGAGQGRLAGPTGWNQAVTELLQKT